MLGKTLFVCWVCLIVLVSIGCVSLAIATAAGIAVHTIGEDSVEAVVDADFNKAWDAAIYVVSSSGDVTVADKSNAKIEAEVGSSDIKVRLYIQSPRTTRIRVEGRKLYRVSPDVKAANSILVKIINRLKR